MSEKIDCGCGHCTFDADRKRLVTYCNPLPETVEVIPGNNGRLDSP